MMRTVFRFLAVVPVMAVAWACSEVGPADPSSAVSGTPSAAVTGDASAMGRASCAEITAVEVKVVPAVGLRVVALRATYVYATPGAEACTTAPAWQASRAGLNIDPRDPFKASLARQIDVKTTVTATAPNGIEGSLVF
jgi:hypothetical protein